MVALSKLTDLRAPSLIHLIERSGNDCVWRSSLDPGSAAFGSRSNPGTARPGVGGGPGIDRTDHPLLELRRFTDNSVFSVGEPSRCPVPGWRSLRSAVGPERDVSYWAGVIPLQSCPDEFIWVHSTRSDICTDSTGAATSGRTPGAMRTHAEDITCGNVNGNPLFRLRENFRQIGCPNCAAEIDLEWWHARMNDDAQEGSFRLAHYRLPVVAGA